MFTYFWETVFILMHRRRPIVETNMMASTDYLWSEYCMTPIVSQGYASSAQVDTGLHMRQRSRAFIVAEAAQPSNRIVFINSGKFYWPNVPDNNVEKKYLHMYFRAFYSQSGLIYVIDIAMGDTGVRRTIVSLLSSQYPDVYSNQNIAFVGTHQHAGVGGYLENLLPQITSLGYVNQTADAIIEGSVLAVQRAHQSLAPGNLSVGNTTVLNANINRSPTAYLANPVEERARYPYNQDKDMTLLRFDDVNGNPRGFLNFFAVHGTSLYEVYFWCLRYVVVKLILA